MRGNPPLAKRKELWSGTQANPLLATAKLFFFNSQTVKQQEDQILTRSAQGKIFVLCPP